MSLFEPNILATIYRLRMRMIPGFARSPAMPGDFLHQGRIVFINTSCRNGAFPRDFTKETRGSEMKIEIPGSYELKVCCTKSSVVYGVYPG